MQGNMIGDGEQKVDADAIGRVTDDGTVNTHWMAKSTHTHRSRPADVLLFLNSQPRKTPAASWLPVEWL